MTSAILFGNHLANLPPFTGVPEAALLAGDLIVPGKTPQVVREPSSQHSTPPPTYDPERSEILAEERAEAAFAGQIGTNPPEQPHPTPTPGSAPLCTPSPQFYWEAAPPSTPTPTPYPPPSLQDVAEGICEAAEAVDPLMPDPATVGGPDVGDIVDQAYLWQQEVPPNNPYFETLVRTPIIVAKKFKDYGAAGTNFVCQQIEHEGLYYDLFPLDQKNPASEAQMAKDGYQTQNRGCSLCCGCFVGRWRNALAEVKGDLGGRLDTSLAVFSGVAILEAMVRVLFFSGVLHPQWMGRIMTRASVGYSLYSFALVFGPSVWQGWQNPAAKIRHSFTTGARAALWMGVLLNLLGMLTLPLQVWRGYIARDTAMVVILMSWLMLPVGVGLGGILAVVAGRVRDWLAISKNREGKRLR